MATECAVFDEIVGAVDTLVTPAPVDVWLAHALAGDQIAQVALAHGAGDVTVALCNIII